MLDLSNPTLHRHLTELYPRVQPVVTNLTDSIR
jgi:hypothetical protein